MEAHKWFVLEEEACVRALESNQSKGLSLQTVRARLTKYGANEWQSSKKQSIVQLFFQQFNDFMVYVLLAAILFSCFLGEWLDAGAIFAIVLMNGVFGSFQEFRAEQSLQALKALSAPTARVLRAGVEQQIEARDLVPGDIVKLEAGDRIPADVRWLQVSQVLVEESALTGESEPVVKQVAALADGDAALGDRKNLGYLGTLILQGTAVGLVVQTGVTTEMGKIASLMQQVESHRTPLQMRLEQLGKVLIVVAIALTVLVMVTGVWRGLPLMEMVLAGVSLAVAAIPEGLPAVVTIALALGVQRMIKQNAIVRKLPAVETLGCVEIICSDKTGTLTQNKMTVVDVWPRADAKLLQGMVHCNNAKWGETEHIGDPTELALLAYANGRVEKVGERVQEFPFDPIRKRMSVVVRAGNRQMIFTKGASESLLDLCTHVFQNGVCRPLDTLQRQTIERQLQKMASQALRVIGFAYRDVEGHLPCNELEKVESKLVFIGLVGMIDPPRAEVKSAIATCRKAGIRTVMITGDHALTAEAIAKQMGLLQTGQKVLEGKQLDAMDDKQLSRELANIAVFARVSPEHKLRIVKLFQTKNQIVAMTGDGVNDAPAIKMANIGIAMGITGTDVSKEAAALVLRDDHFATIVKAIEEGRNIYENVRKVIRYLLASNVGEILTMFFAMLAGLPLPLVPIQILWVNLITDGLPAMALGVDQAERHLMSKRPRGAKEHIFAERLGWKIISRGLLIGLSTIAAFLLVYVTDPQLIHARTVAFATLVMAQLIHVFDCRSSRSIFHRRLLENRTLVAAVVVSFILLLLVVYVPLMQPVFQTVPLYVLDWLIVSAFALFPTFSVGLISLFRSKH